MNFGINVIQIFDQIWTFYFFLERTSMSLTFKRYKFKLNFYKQKSNKTIKKKKTGKITFLWFWLTIINKEKLCWPHLQTFFCNGGTLYNDIFLNDPVSLNKQWKSIVASYHGVKW